MHTIPITVKRKDYPTEDNKNKRQALDYSKETADNKNAKSDGKANLTCNEAVDKQPLSACGATAGSLSTLSGYGSDSE